MYGIYLWYCMVWYGTMFACMHAWMEGCMYVYIYICIFFGWGISRSLVIVVICINQVLFMAMPLSVVGNAMSETWSDRHRILLVTRARRRLTLDFPMRNGDLTIKRMRYEPIIRCSKQCFNWD
jgi:hypothetical protein